MLIRNLHLIVVKQPFGERVLFCRVKRKLTFLVLLLKWTLPPNTWSLAETHDDKQVLEDATNSWQVQVN